MVVALRVARVVGALAEHDAVRLPVVHAHVAQLLVERGERHLVTGVARAQARHPVVAARVPHDRARGRSLQHRLVDALATQEGADVARVDALVPVFALAHLRSGHGGVGVLGDVAHVQERVGGLQLHLAVGARVRVVRTREHLRDRLIEADHVLGQHLLEVELQVLVRAQRLEALGARHARHQCVHHVQLRPVAVRRVGAKGRKLGTLAEDECERGRAERLRLGLHVFCGAIGTALAEGLLVVEGYEP